MNSEILSKGKKQIDSLSIFILGVLIFISDDTILFGTNIDTNYLVFKYFAYFVVIIILLMRLRLDLIKDFGIYFLYVILVSIALTSVFNLDFSGGYAYQAVVVFLAFLIVQSLDFSLFSDIFTKYVFVLSSLSLLIFLVASYSAWILDYFPTGENTAGVEFVTFYVGSVYRGVGEVRNASIFREPGVFAIYILFAILFQLFLSVKINIKFIVCFFVALFSTFSTAAFIAMSFAAVGYMFKDSASCFQSKIVLSALFFMIMAFVFGLQEDFYYKLFSKLDSDSTSFGSLIARAASIVVNFEIFKNNLLFGSGLRDYGALFQEYSILYFEEPLEASGQSTNSYMSIFANFGLLYGLVVIWALIRLSGKLSDRFVVKAVLFVLLGLIFSSQDMRYSLFFYVLIFYGLKNHKSGFHRFA